MAVGATSTKQKENNRRFALIIAASEYQDSDFQKLIAPGKDAEALASVLKNPEIGGYDDVKVVKNEPAYKVSKEIHRFFSNRNRNDLLLLYFSCHGVKDEDGRLYYAAIDTDRKLLASTAISGIFVNERMSSSRSRRQVLVIDCCYSGAFVKGFVTRADKKIHTGEYFEQGRGRIVLTASDSMQYSFEEDKLQVEVNKAGSIFTCAIVEGLNTGKADLNEDGLVSYDELYEYTYDRVSDEMPNQLPQKWVFGVEGDVVVAKNPYIKTESIVEDPNELVQEALGCLKKGEYEAAIEYSDKVIKIKPTFALAYNIKGQAYFSLRKYEEALFCYEKTLELRPNDIEGINNKGLVHAAIGDYSKALECFNQSTEIYAGDASIWNYKGLAYHGLRKYEDAISSSL
jgi:hypothetical protein